ncbi:MAG: septation protein IspZ [Sphingomonadales bacterium]|nr:septation protein IspZ [Sphingomonadales bacterium]MDE2169091.1 septation protein IspZ [Sphingomonadales bacterium]
MTDKTDRATDKTTAKRNPAWLPMAIDYGPVLVFFLAYRLSRPASGGIADIMAVTQSTMAFMGATLIALIVSKWRLGRIAPMLWLSSVLVCGFGALTIFFHDATWVQIKPTVIYLLCGGALLIGNWRRKPLLKILLGDAFTGLDEIGWVILSRNWGWFFLFLAALNEGLRHIYNQANHNFDTWIAMKLYVFMPLSFLFTFAHMPMLLKHGLGQEKDEGDEGK